MWIWFIMPGCAAALIILWLILGRDKKTIPTITMSPPEGLDPLEMEYAQIANISDRGIFAMLLYWVSKGILEVREAEERIGVKRIKPLPQDVPPHARFLYDGMFGKSELVWLDEFPEEVTEHKTELRDKVAERFTGKDPVVQDDSMTVTIVSMLLLIISIFVIEVTVDVPVILAALLGILLFCTIAFLQNGALGFRSKYDTFEVTCGSIGTGALLIIHMVLQWLYMTDDLYLTNGFYMKDGLFIPAGPFIAVFAVCFLICVPCIMFMERRVNHRLYGQILGFRQYIETAEWDRLKQLSEEEPDYGMAILPYAMLFRMGTSWTARFENDTIYNCVNRMEEMTAEDE